MFHPRNSGDSHASFQPRNVALGVAVVAGHPRGQIASLVRVAGCGDPGDRAVLDEHVRSEQNEAGDRATCAGEQQGDRSTIAVADQHRALDPQALEELRQDGVGFVVHVVDQARLVDHRTRPVTVARVDDHRRPTCLASHVVGKRAPEVDRAESLVEEHQRRVPFGARPGGFDADVQLASPDVHQLGRRHHHCRRTNRWILPVAVLGRASTTW